MKSGYGLDIETELRMLRAARRIGALRPVHIVTTFLGAHAMPPEFSDDRATAISTEVVLAAHGAAAMPKGWSTRSTASARASPSRPTQIARVFERARALGLPVKLHAEQLSNLGGAAMAARHGALSADHLEYLDADGVAAMAAAGTVAVLLPGAFYTLRETQLPPVEALREAGVRDGAGDRLQSRHRADDLASASR